MDPEPAMEGEIDDEIVQESGKQSTHCHVSSTVHTAPVGGGSVGREEEVTSHEG